MAWRTEKTDEGRDFVWDGVETGIAPSPTKGTANIQNANISTETGEVMASYARTAQQQAAISNGTLTASVSDGNTLLAAPSTLKAGTWILVSASSVSSITPPTGATTSSIDYLAIGGGGSGGNTLGSTVSGGGGAGAYRTGTTSIGVGTYAITIGAGGTVNSSIGTSGNDGSSSSIAGVITAAGGSGGGGGASNLNGRATGGSGGGGGSDTITAGTGGAGSTGGNAGGNARSAATAAGGGGGGSGGVGGAGTSGVGGNGGAGTANSITGTSVTYAGGGGGGCSAIPGTGSGGGGTGGAATNGSAGTANTGGGGGGTGGGTFFGGAGGSGIVVISYTTGTMYATGGSVTKNGTKTVHIFTEDDIFTVVWINTGGYYYVSYKDTNNKIKLSANYDPTAAHALTHGTSGTITFSTVATIGPAIAKTTEKYTTSNSTEYRYYVLDSNGYVWCYDTAIYDSSLATSGVATLWMLIDYFNYSTFKFGGISVLNGWLMAVSNTYIYAKPTSDLGRFFVALPGSKLNNPFPTHSNFAYTGHQGKMYYCDGNYIGEVFATTSLVSSIANIQSFSQYSASSTTGTISAIISGSLPYSPDGTRIPTAFFTDQYGTMPTALNEGTVYYVDVNANAGTFKVYSSTSSTSPLDISTGASGNQFLNTFYPLGIDAGSGGSHPLVQLTTQRVNLPAFETAQCMVEIGNTVLIGGITNTIYPWNQVDATPSDIIELPESNVRSMTNANNMAYVFVGNKGNVYISNGSIASHVFKVPDYCAGVPGTPLTYIEPYFIWGDSMYVRGRVYFSILDQTSTKAGNCGGVWSFIPSENLSQFDEGLALRLENQNSYGTYNGVATILIPNEEQNAVSPQYWSFWQDSYSTGTSSFGVDYTATTPVTKFVIETDLLPTGSFLSKDTFQQLEYKLTTPLASGDAVQLYYRLNSTDAWTSCGSVMLETDNPISGYFDQVFQKTQWVQFRTECTTGGTTSSSFVRFKQIMLR